MLRAVSRVAHFVPAIAAAGLLVSGCQSCERVPAESAAPEAGSASVAPVAPDAGPINVTTLPTASVASLLNPDQLPPYTGPTGSVEGTISVRGPSAPETPGDFAKCPDAAATYGRAFREGEPASPGGSRWLADAVVAVTGYSGFYIREKAEAVSIAIKGCAFDRRTLTMTFGQRVDVKNETKEFWTPILEPSGVGVIRMATPGGDPVKLTPKRPGYYRIADYDRKYAFVELYAFLHPLHTTSSTGGTYRIDGVPVGKVKVNTSHPRLGGEASVEVDIKAGVVQRVDLTLDHKPALPAASGRDGG